MNAQPSLAPRERVEHFGHRHRTGLITILFTDIIGSTEAKRKLGDQCAAPAFEAHHRLVREVLSQFSEGEEIETAGDSFLLVFAAPSIAVRFALQLQARLSPWPQKSEVSLQDRIGIHVGEVLMKGGMAGAQQTDLFGLQIDVCARVMSLAQAGQILMTRSVFDGARPALKGEVGTKPLQWLEHGFASLKGLDEPVEIFEVREIGRTTARPATIQPRPQPQVRVDQKPMLAQRPNEGKEESPIGRPIVEAIEPELHQGLWRRFSSKTWIKVPSWEAITDLFHCKFSENGKRELRRLTTQDAGKMIEGTKWDVFYRVSTAPLSLELPFAALKEGDQTHAGWDLILSVSGAITDSKLFLESGGWNLVSPGVPLLKPMLESWVANAMPERVRDEVQRHSIEYLRDENGLSGNWWIHQLHGDWFAGRGITFEAGAAPKWSSLEGERASAERRWQVDHERLQQQKELQRQSILREQTLLAEFEIKRLEGEAVLQKKKLQIEADLTQRKALIEHDQRLAQEVREHQLQLLEQERRPKLLEAEAAHRAKEAEYRANLMEAEAATRKIQQAADDLALQHLFKMAELQEKQTSARHAQAERERKRVWDLKHQEEIEKATFEECQKKIVHQSKVSEIERAQQLETLQRTHHLSMAEMDQAIQKAQRASDDREDEYRVALARLQGEQEAIAKAKAWQEETSRKHTELGQRVVEAEEKLAELGGQVGELLALLNDKDSKNITQAVAWLAQEGLTAKHLSALGYSVTPQKLLEKLKERADGTALPMKKVAMRTRSIHEALRDVAEPSEAEITAKSALARDIATRRIDTLRIHDSLEFEFAARRSGYVTLLNIGTSGAVFLHAPNAFAGREAARAVAGGRYTVPGPELLPGDKIQGYFEDGPSGWEHLAAIISDQPIIPEDWIGRSSIRDPIVKLGESDVAALYESLCGLERNSWTAGVLSFFVT